MVVAIIASTGVVLASVYALRMYIRSMHNRQGPAVTSFDMSLRDAVVLVPLVLRHPRLRAVPAAGARRRRAGGPRPRRRRSAGRRGEAATAARRRDAVKGPDIDWAALSPLVALTAGACIVLLVGLLRVALRAPPARAGADARRRSARPRAWASGSGARTPQIIERALAIDDLTLALTMIFVVGGRSPPCCCRGARARRGGGRARASTTRCC